MAEDKQLLNLPIRDTIPGGPFIAMLILAGTWVFTPVAALLAAAAMGKDFGALGNLAGLFCVGLTMACPRNYPMRGSLCAAGFALAAKGGSTGALVGAALNSFFVWLVTCPTFSHSPRMVKLFTETLCQRKYFARCELRGELESIKPGKVCYGVHPHGIITAGFSWNFFWNTAFNDKAGKVSYFIDVNLRYRVPGFRQICDIWQTEKRQCYDASKSSMQKAMKRGDALVLIPGGFEDATIMEYGKDRVALKKRKGLVKYCLEHGYKMVPTYTFGESDTYFTFTGFLKQRMKLNKYGIPAVGFLGNPFMPSLPRADACILSFVGAPLELPQIDKPTSEDVDEWHGKYLAALEALFDKHKADAGKPNAKLEIW